MAYLQVSTRPAEVFFCSNFIRDSRSSSPNLFIYSKSDCALNPPHMRRTWMGCRTVLVRENGFILLAGSARAATRVPGVLITHHTVFSSGEMSCEINGLQS